MQPSDYADTALGMLSVLIDPKDDIKKIIITRVLERAINDERERCARIIEKFVAMSCYDPEAARLIRNPVSDR